MENVFIIGFKGESGAGKDTYADAVKSCLYEKSWRALTPIKIFDVRFADGVKEFVSKMTGASIEELNDQEFKKTMSEKYSCSYRQLLIAIGEGFRTIDPLYWVKYTMSRITAPGVYLVRDMRTDDEVEAIQEVGGIAIHLTPGYETYEQMEYHNTPLEVSAREWKGCDMQFVNNDLELVLCDAEKIINFYLDKVNDGSTRTD